jgi:hypothetical protein
MEVSCEMHIPVGLLVRVMLFPSENHNTVITNTVTYCTALSQLIFPNCGIDHRIYYGPLTRLWVLFCWYLQID